MIRQILDYYEYIFKRRRAIVVCYCWKKWHLEDNRRRYNHRDENQMDNKRIVVGHQNEHDPWYTESIVFKEDKFINEFLLWRLFLWKWKLAGSKISKLGFKLTKWTASMCMREMRVKSFQKIISILGTPRNRFIGFSLWQNTIKFVISGIENHTVDISIILPKTSSLAPPISRPLFRLSIKFVHKAPHVFETKFMSNFSYSAMTCVLTAQIRLQIAITR